MRKHLLFHLAVVCSFAITTTALSQSRITGVVKGLANGDSAIVRIQKTSESFFFKKIGGNATNADVPFDFPNLSNGKWALSIDAKGYLFPVAKALDLNNNTFDNVITLTKAPSDSNFSYQWQDDSSYVGHAQQAYINDKVEIQILGKAEKIPDDFNAINILNEYGFYLSDENSIWTSEDSYRLYQTLKKLNFQKFGERDSVKVKAKWILSEKYLDRDIDFITQNGIDIITISRAAFTYASPLVVTVDGIKGKFFSKRLFTAIVYYYTDKGIKGDKIAEIAKNRYGFEFLSPSSFVKTLMNETETNFQEFTSDEKIIILSMFEEFPDAMQRQKELKYMVRRVNGQKHPIYPLAPAIAWTSNENIEWMESAFKEQDITYMQRLVLHEKAHFLWEYTFDKTTKDDWAKTGGWFLDPTSGSGWTTSNTTEFVSAYAHLKNPNEDMAESVAFYITNPEALRSRSLKKFEFIRDRIMTGTRYISIIRPDLTFQVYNLYPDYNYPGKIKRTKLEVFGKENEDKKIVFEIELTILNKAFDGAEWASCRFTSSIGTIKDMFLRPINNEKSILRGELNISKFAKSGYWIIPQITISDLQGNMRLENNSTYGVKCFINNPSEDVTPPLYIQKSLKLDSISVKLIDFSGRLASQICGSCADTIKPSNAIQVKFDMIEKNTINPDGRALVSIYLPTFDSTNKYNIQPYSFETQINGDGILNDKTDSIKTAKFYFPVPDYFPSGFYSISSISMTDVALNVRQVLLDKDTSNKYYFIPPTINQRAVRDSIYMKTKYPDLKPPMLDINDIQIKATPTNPTSPNGETLFEMWLWIKDESDFPGNASGFAHGYYVLRDPQGLEKYISMQNDLGNLYYSILPDSSIYGFKRYYFKTLLPIGSPPGLWGVSAINIRDHAMNRKYYSFVEYVRFDVEQSNQLQVTPYVEILGKKINALNVDSVGVKIGCKSCKDQNYRIRMYSSMGGNSVVYEGKMSSDTISLSNLKLSGVNDGILYATVFILDSTKALIGTGRATYTKDTQIPRSQQLQTNLANFGKSNLDSLIVSIQTTEKNGSYNLVAVQTTVTPSGSAVGGVGSVITLASGTIVAAGDSVTLSGTFTNGNFQIPVSLIKSMLDGVIELRFYLIDSVGNVGEAVKKTFYKDTKDPVISFKKTSQTGLNTVVSLTTNEFVSNSVNASQLSVKNATITAVEKLDAKNFKITLTRTCADTLGVELKAGILLDTVGNANAVTTYQLIDTLVPLKPQASAVSLCQGGSANPLTATGTSGNSLVWYGTSATGGTGSSSTAPTPSTADAGTVIYYVSQKNGTTACEGPRASIEVVVNPIPSTPTISRDVDGNLVSSSPTGNQWYRENTLIQGATGRSFKPTDAAYYTVKTTRNGCTSTMSDTYYFVVTALSDLSAGEFIRISPNPVQQRAAVEFVLNGASRVEVQVADAQGRVAWHRSKMNSGSMIDLTGLKSGLYLITFRIKETGKHHVMRIIKN